MITVKDLPDSIFNRRGEKTMRKVKDFFCHLLFILAFFFVASGMLECCVLKLLEVLGL